MRFLASLVAALAFSPAAHVGNSMSWNDPAGDVQGIPDIVSFSVTSTDPATLTFHVAFAATPAFGNGVGMAIVADLDNDTLTGHGDGVDHWFVFSTSDGSFRSECWSVDRFVPCGSTATGVVVGNEAVVTANAKELRAGATLRLNVSSYNATQQDQMNFMLFPTRFATPLTASFNPRALVAGRRFAATGSFTCTARVGSVRLNPVARCAWAVPKNAGGKKLMIVVRAADGRSRTYAFVVRRR